MKCKCIFKIRIENYILTIILLRNKCGNGNTAIRKDLIVNFYYIVVSNDFGLNTTKKVQKIENL